MKPTKERDIRLKQRSAEIGTSHIRKLRKYSIGFNEKFKFFYRSYKSNILTFCGSNVNVEFDKNGPDAKEAFRLYDDGFFKNKKITSRHPNLLKAIITAKKSWGLFVSEWSSGIADCDFTKSEILTEFSKYNIEIPSSFLLDFENAITNKKNNRNLKYLEQLKNSLVY